MSTPGSTQSMLRQTLKLEDEALSERLPTVAVPPPVELTAAADQAALPPVKPLPAKPALVARQTAASQAVPPSLSSSVPGLVVSAAVPVAEPAARPQRFGPATPSSPARALDKHSKLGAGKAKAPRAKAGEAETIVVDSFTMPAGEYKRIKVLRDVLARQGCKASKSDVLRVGLVLLATRELGEIARIIGSLPKVSKRPKAAKEAKAVKTTKTAKEAKASKTVKAAKATKGAKGAKETRGKRDKKA